MFHSAHNRGFTLVELLVTLSIIGLVFFAGQANFRDFQRRRQLDGVVESFRSQLVVAQQKALSGDRTGCCTGVACDLVGHTVAHVDSDTYSIGPSCGLSAAFPQTNLPDGYTFASSWTPFTFETVGGGLSSSTNITITISQANTNQTGSVTVTPTGEIR